MIRTFLAATALATLIGACSPAGETDVEPVETAEAASPEAGLPEDATGFITANPLPLADDGSIRRDDYGRPYEYALLAKQLPHFTGTMLDGTEFDSSSLTNWTVIDVWGLWCGDCLADGPYAAALATAIDQDPDLDFLSIHVPASAARTSPEEMYKKWGTIDAYFEEKGYSYPVVIDPDTSLRTALQIGWTPSYILVSPDGVVKGYRSEFSAAEGEPVKDFLKDVARVKAGQ